MWIIALHRWVSIQLGRNPICNHFNKKFIPGNQTKIVLYKEKMTIKVSVVWWAQTKQITSGRCWPPNMFPRVHWTTNKFSTGIIWHFKRNSLPATQWNICSFYSKVTAVENFSIFPNETRFFGHLFQNYIQNCFEFNG